ncbi:MAG: alpha/beta hydrolase [Saprospiraceae bacterium]|nr:alpha/beta hydrolase [Saprospiraceae bacterium]MBK6567033.1 alpha/beta hydrolase [Saprospiraceae bacterium]MBK6783903.1 alpha/beta hydrolase [Saprospiraceae bacterium]MBK8372486.1 alpha/beta hydrolase [Saprospiraceae bacterium]MBK8855084.1 alpha/beta hydrolase [Saprospiraceae bacterium]
METVTKAYHPIIEILEEEYEIPQLNRKRRIAVLLPHDYYKSNKYYPVLYLHDGQNLFDDYAPYGNWGVDKSLAHLSKQGKGNVVIVAIDHGGPLRIKELLPYPTSKYTEVEGQLYLKFMMETLKPMIDNKYRVMVDRDHTGIGGSSLGGLISLYAGFIYRHIFGKMMIFSPSLWISEEIYRLAKGYVPFGPTDLYLYAGGMESASHYGNVLRMENILQEKRKYDDFDIHFSHNPKGEHREIYWGQQFPIAMDWLYQTKR